jgi:hypothetical protein
MPPAAAPSVSPVPPQSPPPAIGSTPITPPVPPVLVLSFRRLLCPGCRWPLSTYSTCRRQAVTVRYHRCGHCGATSLRSHETPDGVLRFVGWASRHAVQIEPERP